MVVSVDGEPWSNYESGVFDGCRRDATVNHAVLLVGYGHDFLATLRKVDVSSSVC